MIAYISWHRPATGVERDAYERALEHFHRSLAHRPPSGFRASAVYRAPELPWLAAAPGGERGEAGYEDWYLLDGYAAMGVLEEAAVSRGHISSHDAVARLSGVATSGIYRLSDGHPQLAWTSAAVWVSRPPGAGAIDVGDLLADGMDPERASLWRRSAGLGPAPEYCLLASESPAGVTSSRLPAGWSAYSFAREVLWHS